MTVGRSTQSVVEVLLATDPPAIVTQVVIETLVASGVLTPTLSSPGVTEIGSTSVRPRVTVTW